MTRVAWTSIKAYFGLIEPTLEGREKDVLSVFTQNTTMNFTNCEIGNELNLPDKSITGRVHRLRGKGKDNPYVDMPYLVEAEVRKCRITGNTAKAWAINPDKIGVFKR